MRLFVLAEEEKAGEEKEKEKHDDTNTTTEATDAKEKTEVADVKKGEHRCTCFPVF